MKKLPAILLGIFLAAQLLAQGTIVFDQQSTTILGSYGSSPFQSGQPMGQSFTPTLDSVQFIRLYLSDSVFNGLGATVIVNLRSDSITGQILGTSLPVSMPDRFSGYPDFNFTSPIHLTPGVKYFFQPVVQSGDNTWGIVSYPGNNYSGGTLFMNGNPVPTFDLWFQEGIIVPEPTSLALALMGVGGFLYVRKRR